MVSPIWCLMTTTLINIVGGVISLPSLGQPIIGAEDGGW